MERKVYYLVIVFIVIAFSFTILLGLSFAESSKDLYPLAKKEGTVTFGGPTAEELVKGLLETFEAKYPGVKVQYVRKSSGPFMSLIETERQAGKVSFDAIHSSDPIDIERLKTTGYFMQYKPENWDMIPAKLKDKDGYYVSYGVTAMLGGYNPKSISAAEAPKSYKDFLNPKWKNMISSSSPSRGGSGLCSTIRAITLYGWDYIQKLADLGAMSVAGHGSVVSMLISGERPLSWDITGYRAIEEESHGNPLKIIWFSEGAPVNIWGMGIPKLAPHPNAGKLLVNFLMSREGQAALVKHANLWSSLPNMEPPKLCKPLEQSNVWYPDMDYLLKNGKEIGERFDKIFGLK